ncbi:MAG: FeoB small GTPase domain-containing protein, partial [Candidatus Heimdallarchaeaceae archaeon]
MPKKCHPTRKRRRKFHKFERRKTFRSTRFGNFLKPKYYDTKNANITLKDHPIEHTIAFLGNPNVGKSSLFNSLTGGHQHIGNWPGKTVEKKEGHFMLSDEYFSLFDLPGTYSLSARSEEEVITRNFVVEENPDLVCVIVDATRLERTLYLALQALELNEKVAVIVNMMDIAERENIVIDTKKLEKKLGVPVITVCSFDDSSIIKLKKFLYDALHTDKYSFHPAKFIYSQKIEFMIKNISEQIEGRTALTKYP